MTACRVPRRSKNRDEFIGLPTERPGCVRAEDSSVLAEFQPEERLVCFLQDKSDLGEELFLGSCSARGAIVCRY